MLGDVFNPQVLRLPEKQRERQQDHERSCVTMPVGDQARQSLSSHCKVLDWGPRSYLLKVCVAQETIVKKKWR